MDALRSHGYMKESLRLAVAIVRSLKHQQRVNKDRCRYQNEGTDLLMHLMAVVHFKHCNWTTKIMFSYFYQIPSNQYMFMMFSVYIIMSKLLNTQH